MIEIRHPLIHYLNKMVRYSEIIIGFPLKIMHILKVYIFKGVFFSVRAYEVKKDVEQKYQEQKRQVIRAGGLEFSRDNLLARKKSDILFVLGSGSSINSISKKGWAKVAKHDSFSFNQFIAHPYVPTYHNQEAKPREFFKNISLRDDYSGVAVFFNMKHIPQLNTLDEYRFSGLARFTIPRIMGGELKFVEPILRFNYKNNRYLKNNFYIHYRGSLSLIISAGVLLGYKHIVLLGVDLNNYTYFFENKNMYESKVARRIRANHLEAKKNNRIVNFDGVHSTIDKSIFKSDATIIEFLELYNRVIKEELGVKLWIGNKSSALYPMLDYYDVES